MPIDQNDIFDIESAADFESLALDIFRLQYHKNRVYREFCDFMDKSKESVKGILDIPFLPISFFKTKKIVVENTEPEIIFRSSGTTGSLVSKHFVSDIDLYKKSFSKSFELFYGAVSDYCVLALLPSYLGREGSSLIYMVKDLINKSGHPESGFYLYDLKGLHERLVQLESQNVKTLLVGVSFALLDLIEKYQFQLKNTVVLETGGMKGRRKEIVREELHARLKEGFGLNEIHSEYGMTELLSQAYSDGRGIFNTPPWMKILIRDTEDPLSWIGNKKIGGVNIIDLANINSCSFVETQDLGRGYEDGSFEILGRFDHSDVRGCNLMAI